MKILLKYAVFTCLAFVLTSSVKAQTQKKVPIDSIVNREVRILKDRLSLSDVQTSQVHDLVKGNYVALDSLKTLHQDTASRRASIAGLSRAYEAAMKQALSTEKFSTFQAFIEERRQHFKAVAIKQGKPVTEARTN